MSLLLQIKIGNQVFSISDEKKYDISIPMIFDGPQPNLYDSKLASAKPYQDGSFIGDTRQGGGCNFDMYNFCTHLNGTHTECVGHIVNERTAINEILNESFMPAILITLKPVKAFDSDETYIPDKKQEDLIITADDIKNKLEGASKEFLHTLIIRTLPNDESKKSRSYMQNLPSYFSTEAIQYITKLGIQHLVVDLPSLDRTFDEGKLSNHHTYWDVKQGENKLSGKAPSLKTITEMAYIPDNIKDGQYVLNIQIPNFVADAAPSRLFLYEMMKLGNGKDASLVMGKGKV